jgi:hypothetical protein
MVNESALSTKGAGAIGNQNGFFSRILGIMIKSYPKIKAMRCPFLQQDPLLRMIE